MDRLRQLLTRHGLDALIVVAALGNAAGPVLRRGDARPDDLADWIGALVLGGAVLVLLLRQRFPFAAPATTWVVNALVSFVDGSLVIGAAGATVAGVLAALLLGNLDDDREARAGLALVVGGAVVIVDNNPDHTASDFFSIPVLFVMAWLVGFALRERTHETEAARERARQAERDRDLAARVAVAEERARIARELHDVVAHAVSVMVLQVGAVRHRMKGAGSGDREALENVEHAGRTALAEMRRLLDAMRHDDDATELAPHPGLHDLDALLKEVRATGLDVDLEVSGDAVELPPVLGLSAFRIVQEGLTNALKHAHASRAVVRLDYGATDLGIEVHDDGRGASPARGNGYGLLGIGERVKIYGGEMTAGSSELGGFALRVRLPLEGR